MRIARDQTGEIINAIVNHPEVQQGPIDLRALAREPFVHALIGGDPPLGTHVCVRVIPGVYEFHSAVLPEGRGGWTEEFTDSCILYMFARTDCIELITRIPQGSLAATTLARKFWFKPRWTCGRMLYKGQEVPFTIWSLTMQAWMPCEEEDHDLTIKYMQMVGQEAKANAWDARRKILSREIG